MSKKELLSDRPDSDNPEWTDKEARNATQFRNLPALLQEKLARGKRGPQKAPRKIQTAIPYDAQVLKHFQDQGDGWQTRMTWALKTTINIGIDGYATTTHTSLHPPKTENLE